jgi:hypothetical protein
LLARRRPEVGDHTTAVLDRYEIPDVAEGEQRELANDAVAGDSVAIQGGRETSSPGTDDLVLLLTPLIIIRRTITPRSDDPAAMPHPRR